MWTFLLGAALAGDLGGNLQQVARSPDGVAVSCADGALAWNELARLGPLFGDAAGLGRERWGPVFAAGVPLVAALDLGSQRFEVAFASRDSAEQVARQLEADDPTAVAAFTPGGWVVRRGDAEYRVRAEAGWAHLEVGAPAPELAVRGAPPPLLAALPAGGGCLLVGRLPEADEAAQLAGEFGVHFPLGQPEPIRFAITGAPAELASVIPLDPRPAHPMRTRLPPTAVLALGVAFDRIDLRFFLKGAELAKARALQRALPVTTGVLAAVVGDEAGALEAGAVLPLAPVAGAPLRAEQVARRAARVFRALKFPVERLDATHLRARLEGSDWVWLTGVPGALYVSSGQRAMAEMERGEGTPWATGAFADQAGRYPVVLSSWLAPGEQGAPRRLREAISLAVGVHGGVVTGELAIPLQPDELLALLAGLRHWMDAE